LDENILLGEGSWLDFQTGKFNVRGRISKNLSKGITGDLSREGVLEVGKIAKPIRKSRSKIILSELVP
jgi:hypothetical protein